MWQGYTLYGTVMTVIYLANILSMEASSHLGCVSTSGEHPLAQLDGSSLFCFFFF